MEYSPPSSYDSYAGGVGLDNPTNNNLDEKFKPIIAENVFSGAFKVIKQTLEDSAVRLISQNKKVQEGIEKQKVEVGKDVLWKYIPFILVGTVLTALIVRFK